MMMNPRRITASASSLTTVLLLLVASFLTSATTATANANAATNNNNNNAISESHHPHPQTRQAASVPTQTLTKQKRTSGNTRQSNSAEWPHFLVLELTFDAHPEQVSWKFENARTSKVLGGVAFGGYTQELQANKTMVVPLDILTGEDYDGDDESGEGVLRDYRFVIYDRGGNG
eukprot:CAMPEP_0201917874 /NCGR_PEP_ID=MMETSP0903-20130614/7154_1 /ASSEMBLY_ACC=CAM_ASM_000552 /TAXON_ID=420261 /ORGANISM="Thalassiosira antarctica, Strain CCMP982" /LENGTH=173 /DNA_ID=CAMNT_0048454027 /DNA_START=60 /DNA_END=577 /DNA_ORIENTATION=-